MQRYYKFLFGLILAVLLIPSVAKVPIDIFEFTIMPLRGYYKLAEYPELTRKSWFDGSYQKDYEVGLEDHIGLRNFFVRFHNQIEFSLYRKCMGNGIVVGKEDYMYEQEYIDAYTGKTFVGQKRIDKQCERLQHLQDTLHKLGTDLIIVIAPGKASMFPEYIPDSYLEEPKGITNLEAYEKVFREKGINYLDLNKYFMEMKDTSANPLYHKAGIHWNTYSAYLALDSMVGYMESLRGIDMADMSYEGIELLEIPRKPDYDLGESLNIFSRIKDRPMPYPYGHKYVTNGKVKPDLMVVADSYYWNLYRVYGSHMIWGKHHFRYYDRELYTANKPVMPLFAIKVEEMTAFDFIVILYTEMNMHNIGNTFIEKAYARFFESWELEQIHNRIRNDQEWLSNIQEKADNNNISLEEQMDRDAVWLYTERLKQELNN